MITQEEVAHKLVWGLWRSVSTEYKKMYARDVWEHFENALRSASYTDSLKVFLSNFRAKIPCSIDGYHAHDVLAVVDCGSDYEVLDWLRSETVYLVLLVRVRNQEAKEQSKTTINTIIKQ